MTEQELLATLRKHPETTQFNDVIRVIDENYCYAPALFTNGVEENPVINEAGSNEGSCKIFSFALIHGLSKQQTLHCFGDYYRCDVLEHPDGTDHANIRRFMRDGWPGIHFDTQTLTRRTR